MDFLEKYNLDAKKVIKIFGVVFLGLIIVSISFAMINGILGSINGSSRGYAGVTSLGSKSIMPQMEMDLGTVSDSVSFSPRNAISYDDGYTAGGDAEDFEVTEFNAQIETRNLDRDCASILDLKSKDYIIFERSNKSDTSCNFRFKVAKENTEEILEVLNSLDPRELNENVHTIKKQIEDYTSEEEILKNKLQVMDETLSSAVASYDEISKLATQTRNADSLASVIESKIRIIERLSQEKINTSARLDRISRAKAEQIDKLEYTNFSVYVYENKFVDTDNLKDSWKRSIKSFVVDMNRVAQDLTVGLVSLAIHIFQYLLYLLIILIVVKFVWGLLKKLWRS